MHVLPSAVFPLPDARFLDGAASFNAIAASIAHTLDTLAGGAADTLEDLLEADRQARQVAGDYLERLRA